MDSTEYISSDKRINPQYSRPQSAKPLQNSQRNQNKTHQNFGQKYGNIPKPSNSRTRPQTAKVYNNNLQSSTSKKNSQNLHAYQGYFDNSTNNNHSYTDINQQQQLNEFEKDVPNKIYIDKEKMQHETFLLKKQLQEVMEKQSEFKIKMEQYDQQYDDYQKKIDELKINAQAHTRSKRGSHSDSGHLFQNLKKISKDLKTQIAYKTQEIEKVKKSSKNTKILELESENKAYQDEIIRLTHILDQVVQGQQQIEIDDSDYDFLEQKFLQRNNLLKKLREENRNLIFSIQNFQEGNFKLQQQYQDIDEHYEEDINEVQQEIDSKKMQLDNIQGDVDYLKDNIEKVQNEIMADMNQDEKAEQLLDKVKYQEQLLLEKIQDYIQIDQKYKEENQRLEKKYKQQDQENDQIKLEIQKAKYHQEQLIKLNNNSQNLRQRQYSQQQLSQSDRSEIRTSQHFTQDNNTINNNREFPQDTIEEFKYHPPKFVELVKFSQVKNIGRKLNYKLRAQNLGWDEITGFLTNIYEERSSIALLIEVLMNEPFGLQSEEEATLLARYLVEDNTGIETGKFKYNDRVENTNVVIKSVFKKIIGKLVPFSQEQMLKLFHEVYEIVRPRENGFRVTFEEYVREGFQISADVLFMVFDSMDVEFTIDQKEYIILSIIEESESFDNLNYKKFLEFFTTVESTKQTYETEPDQSETQSPLRYQNSVHSPYRSNPKNQDQDQVIQNNSSLNLQQSQHSPKSPQNQSNNQQQQQQQQQNQQDKIQHHKKPSLQDVMKKHEQLAEAQIQQESEQIKQEEFNKNFDLSQNNNNSNLCNQEQQQQQTSPQQFSESFQKKYQSKQSENTDQYQSDFNNFSNNPSLGPNVPMTESKPIDINQTKNQYDTVKSVNEQIKEDPKENDNYSERNNKNNENNINTNDPVNKSALMLKPNEEEENKYLQEHQQNNQDLHNQTFSLRGDGDDYDNITDSQMGQSNIQISNTDQKQQLNNQNNQNILEQNKNTQKENQESEIKQQEKQIQNKSNNYEDDYEGEFEEEEVVDSDLESKGSIDI